MDAMCVQHALPCAQEEGNLGFAAAADLCARPHLPSSRMRRSLRREGLGDITRFVPRDLWHGAAAAAPTALELQVKDPAIAGKHSQQKDDRWPF